MTKEEYMAFSLPYNLKIKHFDANRESEHICKIEVWHNEEVTISDGEYEYDLLLNDILPILHPLSDLTKEIEHKGERFVPIVRLIEIAFDVEVNTNRVELSFEDDMYIAEINGFEFVFDITDNSLLSFRHNFPSVVPKQLTLFQKLIEWHFDLFGGIENKEAINVNDLKTNPYK